MLSCVGCVQVFATLWTVAHQVPLSTGFSRQQYWSGFPFLPPGDLPDPAIKPTSPALAGEFFTIKPCLTPKILSMASAIRIGCVGLLENLEILREKLLWGGMCLSKGATATSSQQWAASWQCCSLVLMMPKSQPLCLGVELNLRDRVLGEVEKNSFIALPGRGGHSWLIPSKWCVPT